MFTENQCLFNGLPFTLLLAKMIGIAKVHRELVVDDFDSREFGPSREMLQDDSSRNIDIQRYGFSELRDVNQLIAHRDLFSRKPLSFVAHHECRRTGERMLVNRF